MKWNSEFWWCNSPAGGESVVRGMVVCPQPRAAEVGVSVLEEGGNAFDATIAAAFAQMVVDPFMCGPGGMGTLQLFHAESSRNIMIDFHGRAGSGVREGMWADDIAGRTAISGYVVFDDFRGELGYTSIMTPGTVAGFYELWTQFASWSWSRLLQPAIELLEGGIEVNPRIHDFWTRPPMPGLPSGLQRLTASNESRRIYVRGDGEFHSVGARIQNPDFVHSLRELAQTGAESFYRGDMACRIAQDFAANGSFITPGDLADYRPRLSSPVEAYYRGHLVTSNPPPGSGLTLLTMLKVLERFEVGDYAQAGTDYVELLARVLTVAHSDRNRYLGDPDFAEVPVDRLLSARHIDELVARVTSGEPLRTAPGVQEKGTTHLGVVDAHGNAVSVTHTLGSASGVVTPGLGFMYNNSMKLAEPLPGLPNSMAPGKARTTGMSPTIVWNGSRPWLVVGSPGGSVIISAVLQAIVNIVDFGMTSVEAVSAPRLHCEGGPLFLESRFRASVARELSARGYDVRMMSGGYEPTMGRAHVIRLDAGGVVGGADPRGEGGCFATKETPGATPK